MDNMFYDTVMVRTDFWREDAAELVKGTKATAAFYRKAKHGVLIRIGATSKEELQEVINRTISAVGA